MLLVPFPDGSQNRSGHRIPGPCKRRGRRSKPGGVHCQRPRSEHCGLVGPRDPQMSVVILRFSALKAERSFGHGRHRQTVRAQKGVLGGRGWATEGEGGVGGREEGGVGARGTMKGVRLPSRTSITGTRITVQKQSFDLPGSESQLGLLFCFNPKREWSASPPPKGETASRHSKRREKAAHHPAGEGRPPPPQGGERGKTSNQGRARASRRLKGSEGRPPAPKGEGREGRPPSKERSTPRDERGKATTQCFGFSMNGSSATGPLHTLKLILTLKPNSYFNLNYNF